MRDRPLLSLAASFGVVVLAASIYLLSGNLVGTCLAVASLLVAMRRVWLPIWFRVDAQGVIRQVAGRSRRIPWSAVARYEICERGVILFPPGATYRIAAGQALFIPWGKQRQELLDLVKHFVAEQGPL